MEPSKLTQAFCALAEPGRAMAELYTLGLSWNLLANRAPAGDGHPVVFFPGFLARDFTTAVIRQAVKKQGYPVYAWENGPNLGFNARTARHLVDHLEGIVEENGGRKPSIVGHSLGGVVAREIARDCPQLVRSVITLGSPLGITLNDGRTPRILHNIHAALNPEGHRLAGKVLGARALTPPDVPTTSIYSKTDGVVAWPASLNPSSRHSENIAVISSHIGMVFNPLVIYAVLDRLSQPEKGWRPFDRNKLPCGLSLLYPPTPPVHKLPSNPGFKVGSERLFRT